MIGSSRVFGRDPDQPLIFFGNAVSRMKALSSNISGFRTGKLDLKHYIQLPCFTLWLLFHFCDRG
jgi:hypothetical protein